MTRPSRDLADRSNPTFKPQGTAMKKLTTALTLLSSLALMAAPGSSQIVPTFSEAAAVTSVTCIKVANSGPPAQQQCNVTLSSDNLRNTTVPILCLDEMALVCSALEPGDSAMIMGTDHWSYRLAHHVGIELQPGPSNFVGLGSQAPTTRQLVSEIPETANASRAGMGDTVTFGQNRPREQMLSLRFSAVPEDSRCPIDVDCFWEGSAKVELEAEQGGFSIGTYSFEVISGVSRYQSIGSYQVRIVNIAPDQRQGVEIDPKEYSIGIEAVSVGFDQPR